MAWTTEIITSQSWGSQTTNWNTMSAVWDSSEVRSTNNWVEESTATE